MHAVVMTAAGGPEVLQWRDLPVPDIQHPHQLRVAIKAAGINPVDTKLRKRGTYYPDQLPAILGCDGAGIVDATGAQVTRFKAGDAVYFCNGGIGGAPGNYAQYCVLDEHYAARKPASLDFIHAAAVPLVLLTAWEALHERAQVRTGDEVLIHAGAGGVGHIAVQLARRAGARVSTTVGSQAKAEFVHALGAEHVILYRQQDFVAEVAAWSRAGGANLVFDTVGGATFARSFAAARVYGDVVTLLQPDGSVDWKIARDKNLRVSFELMLTPMFMQLHAARQRQTQILEQGAAWFDSGQLSVSVSEVLPLKDAAHAHQLIEQGGMQGKIVLDVG
ncbi:MAG: zinc-dependent alcohol dehydrogenase family protein [Gammaproteobacteria bacterium]|nr:zinc-dependent alcohol dehydrogenase family protein [Gammaproteobacteria bacterium]